MRLLIQRVTRATVTVDHKIVGTIGQGIVAFVGVSHADTEKDAEWLAEKVANLRLFPSEKTEFDRSLLEIGGELLAVSQFTLYGSTKKGRRPDFNEAAGADFARNLYEEFVRKAKLTGLIVAEGVFQAHMAVELVNDGPVTFMIES
ncbi:D-tyrosyl-tRNA(Tyr) deacylase [Candidatus Peregrinibacteria bacterium]|nr:D-tyrosyl-tRNA(Tyr) deacylase [Candidatus Peregrinibacteria bacterium]